MKIPHNLLKPKEGHIIYKLMNCILIFILETRYI
jgi:hypothetical protein